MSDILTGNASIASDLASRGFAVFPCHEGGADIKKPKPGIFWRSASTSDARQVAIWWQKWPQAAIGLDLAKSGLIVIDADRHGEHDGVEAFGNLMAAHDWHPDQAPLAATPNEGNHHFFRQREGETRGNGRGALPRGVDVRGSGGYVIAPGTIMADGRAYELHGDLSDCPVLPDWLAGVLDGEKEPERKSPQVSLKAPKTGESRRNGNHLDERIRSYVDAAFEAETSRVATAGKGERNNALNQAAFSLGQMAGAGWILQSDIEASLTDAALTAGLKQPEIRKTIRSGIQAGSKQPRELPESNLPVANAVDYEASRRLIEAHDGTLHDAETGEIVETRDVRENHTTEYPPGLVGMIARWIVATARRPQPELAVGAALAIVGTAAGRQFCGPTRSGTHLYILGLAPTSAGKDHPMQQIGRVLTAARLGQHIGPSEFISMPGVINFLMRKPLSCCAMDEFGSYMKRINAKRASGFEGAISKILRQMWSSSFAPYSTPEWAGKESVTLHAPAMTLLGTSTPQQFYSAMEGASVEDGTLNRFLLINGLDIVDEREPDENPSMVPDRITDALRSIYFRSGDMSAAWRNDPCVDPSMHDGGVIPVGWCADGSHKEYQSFSSDMTQLVRDQIDVGAFYGRTAEMALRIATIIAVGRMEDDQVRKSDLEFGIRMSKASADAMVRGAEDYMADSENQANAQQVIRILKAHGGTIKWRALLRALQNKIRSRDLKDIVQQLVEAGRLERVEVQGQSGPPTQAFRLE